MNPLIGEMDSRIIDESLGRTIHNKPNLPVGFKEKWKDKYAGQPCLILANGPSLPRREEIGEVMKWTDTTIIGVNRSFLVVPSDIHIMIDKIHTLWYGDLLAKLTPLAELRITTYPCPDCYSPKRHLLPKVLRGSTNLLPDLYDVGIIQRGASVAAFQVAWWLGFDPIIFCGLDLMLPGTHFYPEPDWIVDRLTEHHAGVLRGQIDYFHAAAPLIKANGRRVINTTLDSGEKVFEKISFEEVFGI